jgi:GH35 family endo-1,4-beta-xylanase
MRFFLQLLVLCLVAHNALAQDAYHTYLQNTMKNDYGLPAGAWLLNDTEAANLNGDYWYGNISASNQPTSGQDFSQKVHIQINSTGNNAWDSGYGIRNVHPLNQGSACLAVIWLRSEAPDGKVTLFVENSSTFTKDVSLNLDLSEDWVQYLVPFEASETYPSDGLTIGLHLAWKAQTIEIGGLAMLNYGFSVVVDDLPSQFHNDKYGGWEPDAPWRSEAADRIEQIRKSDLTIRVLDEDEVPILGATVDVKMLKHEFAFGSAVVSRLFAGNNSHNPTYESKLLDLDGEGHGFNWVVFENSLKWPGWETNWIGTKSEKVKAVQWLRDNDIFIRGHTLVWPGWSNLPNDMEPNQGNPAYLKNRVLNHVEDIASYTGIQGNIAEWDVLNEITTNRDLEYAMQGYQDYTTGREIYPEIFAKLNDADPGAKTYINDYVTISQANTGGGLYQMKKQFAQEHVWHISKNHRIRYKEAMGDALAATYMRDFLTMVFSHESMNGFLMWGFWDGAHWHGNAPLFYQDWTLKPAGQTFIDMVFDEWWTEENGQTDAYGEFKIRGFRGSYQVTIDCGDEVLVDTIELGNDKVVVKTDGELITGMSKVPESYEASIYPNPATDHIQIDLRSAKHADIRIFDSVGRQVYFNKMVGSKRRIPFQFGSGAYLVMIDSRGIKTVKKVIVY